MNVHKKPVPPKPVTENFPGELTRNYKFCNWRYEWNDKSKKWTKIPYNPKTGDRARTSDPDTFTDFTDACEAVSKYDGIGVRVSGNLAGIDIDHCIDDDGKLSEMADDIIHTINSYTEVSPSGTGIRILFTVPDGYQYDPNVYYILNRGIGLETHIAGMENRYLTITGQALYDSDLWDCETELQTVLDKYMKRPTPKHTDTAPSEPVDMSDAELIDKALDSKDGEFRELWNGNLINYDSHSEADLALCLRLAFWTGRDSERMDRMFRSSGLMRDKWNRDDYRRNTLSRACDYCTDVYTPPTQKSVSKTGPSPKTTEEETDVPTAGPVHTETDVEPTTDAEQDRTFTVYNVRDYILDRQFENDVEYFRKYKDRKTGFYSIDKNLTLYPGLGAIGASSSLGKTTFCVNVGDNLVRSGEYVLYFSFEQEPIELVTKSITRRLAEVDPSTRLRNIGIKNGETSDTLERVKREYADDVGDHFDIVRCDFRTTASEICDYIDHYIETTGRHPVIFIDYLQLVAPPDNWTGDTRGAIDDNIKLFKTMQLRNELLVILVSNFNRSGYDSPVSYSDYKETGMIEYTCDYIWGLQLEILDHREYYVHEDGSKSRLTTPQEKDNMIDTAIAKYPKQVQFVSLKSRNGKQRYKCNLDYYMDLDYFNDPADPEQLEKRNPYI